MKEVDVANQNPGNQKNKICSNCQTKNISYNILQPEKESAQNEHSSTQDEQDIAIKLGGNQFYPLDKYNNLNGIEMNKL